MNLADKCKKGSMPVEEFFEFVAWQRPRRTHLLKAGDYVASPHPTQEGIIVMEKIAQLNSPEIGDFTTERGATGSIQGSVFIKVDRKDFPPVLLIEGDRVYTGEGSVYASVGKYLKHRCAG